MTIDKIIERLKKEKEVTSRFPVRLIFVESLQDYLQLETLLQGICSVTMNVAEFCTNPDILPKFEEMYEKLSEFKNKQVLVLSMSEYLRINVKRELDEKGGEFRTFWEQMQAADSKTRYIVPMFNCRHIFDRIVSVVDERQKDFIWVVDDVLEEKSYSVTVYSPEFAEAIKADAENFVYWLKNWQDILKEKSSCSIVTKLYRNVESSAGIINIKIIAEPFSYLQEIFSDGEKLDKNWLSDELWKQLINNAQKYASKNVEFKKFVLDELNIKEFDFLLVAAQWKMLDKMEQTLAWMWYRLYPAENYFSYACKKADCPEEIPDQILNSILGVTTRSKQWIYERKDALKSFGISYFPDGYFEKIEKIPDAETELELLTYQTHKEKTFAIKIISKLLRNGTDSEAIASMIEEGYPALSVYIKGKLDKEPEIDEYMDWYRKNKLINRYPESQPVKVNLRGFDARYKLLQELDGKDYHAFWIDGMGIEWIPVFLYELQKRNIVPKKVQIATAKLPTETEFNHQWDPNDPMTTKWDRLDKLSHKGMPDDKSYYSCIANQLSLFGEFARKAEELLEDNEYVVITGDHGSSRLAALAFHSPKVIPTPKPNKGKVYSFGRFCEISDDVNFYVLSNMTETKVNGKKYIVMNDYNHFATGGNVAGGNTDKNDVAGEVHGGNTVEERLVPVIILKRKQPLPPLTCIPTSNIVNRKNGNIEVILVFNRNVKKLKVSMNGKEANCTVNQDGNWIVAMDDVPIGDITLNVEANGNTIFNVNLMVQTGGITTREFF